MRDDEFTEAFVLLQPKLHKFFYRRIKASPFKGDKALLIRDLIQITALSALENSA